MFPSLEGSSGNIVIQKHNQSVSPYALGRLKLDSGSMSRV